MKKILILFICLLLAGCGVKENEFEEKNNESNNKIDETKNDIQKFKEEYESLNENGIVVDIDTDASIKYLELNEVVDFLENKTGIIYFGFPACPWCRNIIPILLDVSIDNNQEVYYFNPKDVRNTDNEDFNKIMNILDEYLLVNSKGKKTLYVPDVYFIKEGKIIGHYLGSVSSQTDPYVKLTESQKEELYNIYKELLEKIN